MIKVINLPDEQASAMFANQLAKHLSAPLVMTFTGEIGAGKTTLIRAMLRSLGIASAIKSPTFSLVESYHTNHLSIHHFDLYRIQDEGELDYIGFRDYFETNAVCCIEWPERAKSTLKEVDIDFSLAVDGVGRTMTVQAYSSIGINMLSHILGE